MKRIVSIGSCNIDKTFYVNNFKDNKINSTNVSFGGKGANQAVSASRLGSQVFFVGCVGNDEDGKKIIENFKKENIDVSGIRVVDCLTDKRIIYVDNNGANKIEGSSSAINNLDIDLIKENIKKIDQADMILFQLKMPKETIEFLINYCYLNNKTTLLTPSPASINKCGYDLLKKVSYIILNQDEIKSLFNNEDYEEVLKKYPNMILTRGKDGVAFYDNTLRIIKAQSLKCVDSTGAGDTFCGAFVYAINNELSKEDAIKFANIAAGIKVMSKGAQNGMPTLETINLYKKKNNI